MTKEIEKNQEEGVQLPPPWCGSICRNAMSEVCIEHCAIKRDCSGFVLKPGLNLIVSPRFPIEHISKMTKEEKFTLVAAYVAMTVDHLKGVQDEPELTPIRRPDHDSSRSSAIPQDFKGEDVLSGVSEANSAHPPGAERESKEIRPAELVEPET